MFRAACGSGNCVQRERLAGPVHRGLRGRRPGGARRPPAEGRPHPLDRESRPRERHAGGGRQHHPGRLRSCFMSGRMSRVRVRPMTD